MYVDTHCHLSREDYDDIDFIIKENIENGVDKMIVSGYSTDTIKEVLDLVDKYEGVYATIGFHPDQVNVVTDEDLLFLEEQLEHKKIVGIGEIGLDYHYGKEDMDQQKELFRKQMALAEKMHLPVVIHSRDAILDTIQILEEFPNVSGDMHCFSGSLETAKKYVSMGYILGIGGVVTFKNSNLWQVVREIGLSHIILETDAPYLTPDPFRGQKNSSKYIPIIAKKVADILDEPIEKIAVQTTKNALSLFDLK